ncbi:hypothetical protein CPB85DRAFT_1295551 [Mucidula mucida]|nr:hypothetical protein CPB85DRAFT_1295551 [Mucidula mucida]
MSLTVTSLYSLLVPKMAISLEAAQRPRESLIGMTLDTRGGSYIFTKVLYRRPDRYVVKAQRTDALERAHAPSLVIKLSLPSAARAPEEKLVNKARAVAIDAGGDSHWVLQHLPRILHSEDLLIVPGSKQAHVADNLHNASGNTCEEDCDEKRTLRIVVMEELLPIDTLSNASDFAQVFFDVLNCHKWLYDNPRILHRDISMSNIMYRFDDDHNVCGVLNDMDLSSDLNDLEDLKATSLRRTGTPPFMAIDLLGKDSHQPEHIYRHDLESLFYVMLILFARYEFIAAEPNDDRGERLVKRHKAPLSEWFDPTLSWDTLAEKKQYFITNIPPVTSSLHMNHILSSSFQGFKPWISRLKNALQDGLGARNRALRDLEEALESGEVPPSFAYETLGGKVQYSTFFDVMKNFGGKVLRAPPYSLDITATTSLQPTLSTTAV